MPEEQIPSYSRETRESRAVRGKRLLAWLLDLLKGHLNLTAIQDELERIALFLRTSDTLYIQTAPLRLLTDMSAVICVKNVEINSWKRE